MTPRGEGKALELGSVDAMLVWLAECAAAGQKCPTNDQVCQRFGFASKASAVRLFFELERQGLIVKDQTGNSRRVQIVSTGQWTAIGGQGEGSREGVSADAQPHRRGLRDAVADAFPAMFPVPETAIDRTPCRRCGVRADVGCRHQPAKQVAA